MTHKKLKRILKDKNQRLANLDLKVDEKQKLINDFISRDKRIAYAEQEVITLRNGLKNSEARYSELYAKHKSLVEAEESMRTNYYNLKDKMADILKIASNEDAFGKKLSHAILSAKLKEINLISK